MIDCDARLSVRPYLVFVLVISLVIRPPSVTNPFP